MRHIVSDSRFLDAIADIDSEDRRNEASRGSGEFSTSSPVWQSHEWEMCLFRDTVADLPQIWGWPVRIAANLCSTSIRSVSPSEEITSKVHQQHQ